MVVVTATQTPSIVTAESADQTDEKSPILIDAAVQAGPRRLAVRDVAVQAGQHYQLEAGQAEHHNRHRQTSVQAGHHPHYQLAAAPPQPSWQPQEVQDAFLPDTEYYRRLK